MTDDTNSTALTSCPKRFSAVSFRTFFASTPATAAMTVVLEGDEVDDSAKRGCRSVVACTEIRSVK